MDFFYPFLALCGFLLFAGITITITIVLWFRHIDNSLRACPECGKKGTGHIIETDILNETTTFERRGFRTYRFKDEHLVDTYQCDNCGHEWTRTLKRKTQFPISNVKSKKE